LILVANPKNSHKRCVEGALRGNLS
jgi:hypothetical protein